MLHLRPGSAAKRELTVGIEHERFKNSHLRVSVFESSSVSEVATALFTQLGQLAQGYSSALQDDLESTDGWECSLPLTTIIKDVPCFDSIHFQFEIIPMMEVQVRTMSTSLTIPCQPSWTLEQVMNAANLPPTQHGYDCYLNSTLQKLSTKLVDIGGLDKGRGHRFAFLPRGTNEVTVVILPLANSTSAASQPVSVLRTDTVTAVKEKIRLLESIPHHLYQLFLDGQLLDDSRPLGDYGTSPLHLEPRLVKGSFEVFLKTLTGKTLTVQVEPTELVEDFKCRIWMMEGIPPAQQRLIYAGKQLEDIRALSADYGMKEGGTIHMVLRIRGGMYHPINQRHLAFDLTKRSPVMRTQGSVLDLEPDGKQRANLGTYVEVHSVYVSDESPSEVPGEGRPKKAKRRSSRLAAKHNAQVDSEEESSAAATTSACGADL